MFSQINFRLAYRHLLAPGLFVAIDHSVVWPQEITSIFVATEVCLSVEGSCYDHQ